VRRERLSESLGQSEVCLSFTQLRSVRKVIVMHSHNARPHTTVFNVHV
jgi:hypothetical protein